MNKFGAFLLVTLALLSSLVVAVEPAKASGNFWVERAPMPAASGYVQAVAVNGEIYAVTPNSTYLYNPSADTWTGKAPIPSAEYGFAMATYQNMIYVFGGCSGFDTNGNPIDCTATTQIYNPATNTWQTGAPMPTARAYLQANVVDGKIYLIDGALSNNNGPYDGTYSTANEVYDPASNSWTTMAPDPLWGTSEYASAVSNNKIYIFYGLFSYLIPVYGEAAECYDVENNTWNFPNELVNLPPSVVYEAGAATISGEIYVIGGAPGLVGSFGQTQIYDPQTGNWTIGAPMLTARSGLGVVAVNGAIYAIGGIIFSKPPYAPDVNSTTAVNEEYFPLVSQEPTTTPTPTPTTTPSGTTVAATTGSGATVDLAISGNITSTQMSNITITTNQSAASTTVSFTVTGESGTTGFSNITIPKSAVPYGTTPTIYIDGQTAQDQGYTQDSNNYYVWYTTSFSTHEVSIVFTAKSSVPEFPSLLILSLVIIAVSVAVVLTLRNRKIGKT